MREKNMIVECMQKISTCLVLVLSMTVPAFADDEDRKYNQIRFQAQISESIANDRMQVILTVHGEDDEPSNLAGKINRDMEWALEKIRTEKTVKANSGGYQTFPVYRKEVVIGWRGRQDLTLESGDVSALSRLVGQLQERLQVRSMSFSVSDEARSAVENRLIGEALDAFKQRARIVQKNFQSKGYRLVDLNINTSSPIPPPVPRGMVRMAAAQEQAPVSVEAGESKVTVSVSGVIELR
jgi:predicted secreted protein